MQVVNAESSVVSCNMCCTSFSCISIICLHYKHIVNDYNASVLVFVLSSQYFTVYFLEVDYTWHD